jgi:hypothetical protein
VSTNEKAAKAVKTFIATHSAVEILAAARKASPRAFSNEQPSRPPPSSAYRNGNGVAKAKK